MALRFCEVCKNPMTEGYVFDDGSYYYCSEEHMFEDLKDDETFGDMTLDELYDDGDGIVYWTDWHGESPDVDLFTINQVGNKLYVYDEDVPHGSDVKKRWVLLDNDKAREFMEEFDDMGTKVFRMKHEPFEYPEDFLFDTLEQATDKYEELVDEEHENHK